MTKNIFGEREFPVFHSVGSEWTFRFSTLWCGNYGKLSHTRFKKFRESNDSTKEITKYVDSWIDKRYFRWE